ncbi:polysaccharide biosynthesis tyrosine autokinase [Zhihengliuella sp.]|uniref:polysaccharide biosynthesis tyrosine autokinase n=1 Tax=Zhihengliuella sp. TaxID=1954483 RepID=UPI002811C03A|nr:polysaccharide biosynthesis tyrosine autokinase [Zhihengliuella sp.]
MEPRDDQTEAGPDLRHYFTIVRSYWKGILAILLMVLIMTFGWTLLQPKVYESSSSGLVMVAGASDLGTALAGDNLSKSKATSYSSIAATRPVAARVKESLGLEASEDELLGRVSVEVPTATAEIRITASAGTPEQAQELANAWVEALSAQAVDLETQGSAADIGPAVTVEPLGRAALPSSPTSPNVRLALAIGAVAGLALGLAYALIRNHLDRRIRSAAMVERLGQAVVGTIPRDERLEQGRAIVETDALQVGPDRQAHAFAEALRELRTNLSYIDVDNPPRSIVVTSSVPAEGKSSLAANLAGAIASTGQRTVLIDADLRRPVQAKIFDLPAGGGLTDVLSGAADLDDVLLPYGPLPALEVLGAGRIPPNPSELLGSKSMKHLIEDLVKDAVVIVDAPPLLPVTDAAVLSTAVDGTLVSVKAGQTTIDELEKSLANLHRVGTRVLGVILNQVPTKGLGSSRYGYYGQYYYSSDDAGSSGSKSKGTKRRIKKTTPVKAEAPAAAEPLSEFDEELHGMRHARRVQN